MELKRQHIFKDILKGSGVYHSAILTCYSFDPFYYSHFFKPHLNTCGIGNQIVLIDAFCLDKAKENENLSTLIGESSFEGYTPLRIECPHGGVFHPKIGLFIGEKRLTVIVGSGNLTYSGMSFNDEVWSAFSITSPDSSDAPVISAVWHYLKPLIEQQELASASLQIDWMLENSELLRRVNGMKAESLSNVDNQGQSFEFAANVDGVSIFSRLRSAVGEARVKTISICSPFYDAHGTAIKNLFQAFSPERMDCLVLPEDGTLPRALDRNALPEIRFYRFAIQDEDKGDSNSTSSFVHAKLIQIETTEGTVLAAGSANASIQALGGETGGFSNDEADIIIRSTRVRDYFQELGIVRREEIVDLSGVKETQKTDDEPPMYREVTIQSCELLEDGYHLKIGRGTATPVDLYLVTDFRKDTKIQLDHLESGLLIIQDRGNDSARTVFFSRNGEQVSNLCSVINRAEVEGRNLDRMLAPVNQLLETTTFESDFTKLLQFVHIEEETLPHLPAKSKQGWSGSAREHGEVEPHVITDEDLEHKVYRNRLSSSEGINERILDRLAQLFATSLEEVSYSENPEDEFSNQNRIDSGLPDTKDKGGKPKKEQPLIAEARVFFKRILSSFDKLSWADAAFRNGRGELDYTTCLLHTPHYFRAQSSLSQSAACIAVFEMCKIAQRGTFRDWREMLHYFVSIVGLYLLIFRKKPEGLTDAALEKLKQKHHNLVVFSLLLIAFWEEYDLHRKALLRLLALNLFDSYKDNLSELESAYNDYHRLIDQGLLNCQKNNVEMLEQSYKAYLSFTRSDEKPKDTLSPFMKKAIIYRNNYGFIQVEDIKYGQTAVNGARLMSVTAFAPGFPHHKYVRNRILRGMLFRTSVPAYSIVFEQS